MCDLFIYADMLYLYLLLKLSRIAHHQVIFYAECVGGFSFFAYICGGKLVYPETRLCFIHQN